MKTNHRKVKSYVALLTAVACMAKHIVATKAIREDMRYYLRQKMEQAMQGVADAEPPVDAEPAV